LGQLAANYATSSLSDNPTLDEAAVAAVVRLLGLLLIGLSSLLSF
jgi:hypothetical protein